MKENYFNSSKQKNMKTLIIITLSFAMSIGAMAQTYITQVKPYGEKLWGYANQNGEITIAAKYKKCYKYAENGLAPIYESKQFLFINTKGEEMTTEITGFKMIEGFIGIGGLQGYNEGMVAVVKNKKWGFLNSQGAVAIELKYDKVSIFNSGFAIAKSGDAFFVVNKSGEEIEIAGAEFIDIKQFSDGLAPFTNSTKQFGYIDDKGKVAIQADFLAVGYFNDGLAWAKGSDKKVGYINKKGEWVIEPKFDAAKNFDPTSGLARIKTEGKWAYTNKNGEILTVDTETWGDFSEGLARGKKGGKTGYYNNKGEWTIAPEYDGGRNFKNGFAAVKKGDKWGFINQSGEWVIEAKYAAVKDLERVD